MPTYDFKPLVKDLIVSDSWTMIYAGVNYIDGISQEGFKASILLLTETSSQNVVLINETERPETPTTVETLTAWVEAELIKYEV